MPRVKSYPRRMPMFPSKFTVPTRTGFGAGLAAANAVIGAMGRSTAQRTQFRGGGSQTSIVEQRKRKRVRRHSFKSKIMAAQPAKHHTYTADQAMTHNTIYTTSPTQGVVQGTTNSTRDGDSIYLAALKGRFHYASATTSNAYVGRIIVGYSGEEYATASDFTSGLGASELFLPGTFGISINGIVNPKTFTVLYDETIDVNSQVSAVRDVASGAFTIQLDTQFPYQASGSTFGKIRNLYVVVMSAVMDGATGTTASGDISCALDLIFK